MKSVSPGTDARIQDEATTWAFLWRATRRDNEVFTFTNHDTDIKIDVDDPTNPCPDNEQTYFANSGYSMTVVKNTARLSVDNLDISSILDPAGQSVTEQDMRAGKWDFAQIELFRVDYENLTDGVTMIRKGFLGEVNLQDDIYVAELRGLVQLLQQTIGEVYAPNCRADLGDSRCKIVLGPITETTEVLTGSVDAANQSFKVPDHHIAHGDQVAATDWRYKQGLVLDTTAVPSVGKFTILKRSTVEDGTPHNPFLLANATDVTNMRDDVLAWYALANDVDMTAFGLFTPIPEFKGGLDGRGFKIQNLDLDHSAAPLGDEVGLFRNLLGGAHVRRLFMEDADVNGGESAEYKAILVGRVDGPTIIEDCFADSVTAGGVATSGDRAGGLVGLVSAGASAIIRRCMCAVPITGTIGTNVGGLVAFDNDGGGTLMENNSFDSDVATTTQTGPNVTSAETTPRTTTEMQTPANFLDPTFDMIGIWEQAVATTSYAVLRRWF